MIVVIIWGSTVDDINPGIVLIMGTAGFDHQPYLGLSAKPRSWPP